MFSLRRTQCPIQFMLLGIAAWLIFMAIIYSSTHYSIPFPGISPDRQATSAKTHQSKFAYATFLATREKDKLDEEDVYFIGTRMLIYQLLHNPTTRTNNSIPFVVLVTPEVEQWKRNRLTADGALVVEAEKIVTDWIHPARPRWEHVMDKLGIFKLTQFEKILLLDSDIVITKSLDQIFFDAETDILSNTADPAKIMSDESQQPQRYLMAAQTQRGPHPILNAGFVILQPSIEMYNHYLSVLNIEGRFSGAWPEQNLWNYVHRLDGNMPWRRISDRWAKNSPKYSDYEGGVASLHEKYWQYQDDPKLRDILLRSRWKMEGFWNEI